MQKQFADFGLAVERNDGGDEADFVGVWDINLPTWDAFRRCETSWNIIVVGSSLIWLGLDYAKLPIVLDRFAGIPRGTHRKRAAIQRRRDELFDELCVMEAAAVGAFGEARR